jgi:hypothetical protein
MFLTGLFFLLFLDQRQIRAQVRHRHVFGTHAFATIYTEPPCSRSKLQDV